MSPKTCSPLFSGVCLIIVIISIFFIPCPVSGNDESHPCLIFDNIDEIPGYQLRNLEPWSVWERSILRNADLSLDRIFLDLNWPSHNKICYRSKFASDLAFAYLITKDDKYGEKAKEALLNLGIGEQSPIIRASSLRGYGLAYDWMQPYLSESDDKIIRNKYAALADTVYLELNSNRKNKNYVSFSDYHGQAYPNVGIAGLVLADFTNPDNIPLQSTPDDWIKAGTDYLFVNDELHSYNRPLISFGFDEESGKNYLGAYKAYVIEDFLWWFQIYSHYYDRNIFDDYPVSKKIVTSEIWETLPNGYMNNYVTSGNTLETYHKGILNLLNDNEKGIVLNYLEKTEGNNILPYSSEKNRMSYIYFYLVYGNYENIVKSPPSWTDHLNPNANYQVFRENWDKNSDWLSLVTFNGKTNSNRDSAHHDQLGIEYYSNGDLLLADAGENKNVIDKNYGQVEVHHNSIAIEDPRTPFPVSSYGNSRARGVYKGDSGGIVTPVEIKSIIQDSWVVLIQAKEKVTNVIGDDWMYQNRLSSPIDYTRTIIYPFKDYFIILDHFDSDEEWIYRNVFRPTSLTIIPTQDLNNDKKYSESETGHVVGDLNIGEVSYDWLNLPYKRETKTGVFTDNILWSVTNPYGNKVVLKLFSVPVSEMVITKHVGRIAGYSYPSEVFSPVIYFRNLPAEELFRITLLLTGGTDSEIKSAEELNVKGNGNAVKVYSLSETDYIYSGKGNSEFNRYKSDAEILFIRDSLIIPDEYYLIFGGTYLIRDGLDFITLVEDNSGKKIKISDLSAEIKAVVLDGLEVSDRKMYEDGRNFSVSLGKGDHTIEIVLESKKIFIAVVDQNKSLNTVDYRESDTSIMGIKKSPGFSLFTLISFVSVLFIICLIKIRRLS